MFYASEQDMNSGYYRKVAFQNIFFLVFQLQSKRELFFKSDTVSGGVSATGPPVSAPPAPPSALKDALAKRSATLPEPHENNHHEPNGTAAITKLSNSVSVDVPKPPNTAPPPTPAPAMPVSAPPSAPVTVPLRSTENIIKVR